MKRIALLAIALLLLSGCSGEEVTTPRQVPASCEINGVIAAFDEQVPGSAYLPTEWEPFEGTDLAATLDNGGIACTYSIQVAEVGGTILWAPADDALWGERSIGWKEAGQSSIDLPGIEEEAAFILQDRTSADEMHVWAINILIDGIWIQVGATFLQTVDEALPIIESAIEATES